MSQLLRVKENEAALHFAKDGIHVINGNKPLISKDMARGFALCYSVVTQPKIFEMLRMIVIEDMKYRKEQSTDLQERMARQGILDLLELDDEERKNMLNVEEPKTD